jgi:hypothetical protein
VGEVIGAMPRDRQTGAALWSVWGEAAKHGNCAGPSGGVQGALVSLSLLAAGQEVEDSPVMPSLVAVVRLMDLAWRFRSAAALGTATVGRRGAQC